jgi:hypothetical protein
MAMRLAGTGTPSPLPGRVSSGATINRWLTPNAPTGSPVRRILVIPDTYLPSVDGALENLCTWYNWELFGTQTIQQAHDAMRTMMGDYYVSNVASDIYGARATVPPWSVIVTNNGITWTSNTAQGTGGWWKNPGTVVNEFVEYSVPLAAGTYTLQYLSLKSSGTAIIGHKMDGVAVGTSEDLYNASLILNWIVKKTGIVVATDSLDHRLRFTATGKNAASSAYAMILSEIILSRTA